MATTTRVPEPGYANQVQGAQQSFRALLDALARPTLRQRVRADVGIPGPLTPAAAATILTLCDDATRVWLDPDLRDEELGVASWLRFHTGAPIVEEAADADFAIVTAPSALPRLTDFEAGTDEAPHTSATLIVIDRDDAPGTRYRADGPGFEHPAAWTAPAFPADFTAQWAANIARFPRGIDLVIAGHDTVTGLPRTTRLTEVD